MTFGERLVYYRERAGLKQKELAEVLEISPTRLNYWEKDKREPDLQMLAALCRELKVEGDVLLGRKLDEQEKVSSDVKESPAPADADTGEISLEESNNLLVALGYIKPGEQISDDDLAFLENIIGLLDAWFSKGH